MPNAPIIPMDEARLARLPATELARALTAVAPRQRAGLLLDRADAPQVVAAMASQDFYLTLKEGTDSELLALLPLATPEHLDHILDLEGWQGMDILPGRYLQWCATMLAAGERPLLTWLYHADFELLVLLFRQWLELQPADEDEADRSPAAKAPSRETIDGVRFFSIRYPDYRDVILYMLRYLFETHQPFYQELFWTMETALTAELEELAERFHRGRLADNAIPDADEAATIYHPLGRRGIQTHDKHYTPGVGPDATFALVRTDEEGLLRRALALLPPGLAAFVQQELTGLANKVVVADRLPVDDAESLGRAAAKAGALVSLGLERYSGADSGAAAATLETVFLEDLFRFAHTELRRVVRPLQEQLREGWLSRWPHGLAILDQEWQEAAEAALATPTPLLAGRGGIQRVPAGTADLETLTRLVATISAAGAFFTFLERQFGTFWQEWRLWPDGQNATLTDVTLGTILCTGAWHHACHGTFQPHPIPRDQWQQRAADVPPDTLLAAARGALTEVLPPQERDAALAYFAPIGQRIADHTANPAWHQDPRLIPFLLFAA